MPFPAHHPWRVLASNWEATGKRFSKWLLRGQVPDRAAQLAFWAILGVFPTLISAFVVFGWVVDQRIAFRQDLLSFVDRLAPTQAVAELVRSVLEEIQASRGSGKFSLGLVVTLWIGSSLLAQIHRVIDSAFGSPGRETWFRRITALPFTLAVLVPMIAVLVLLFYGRLIGLGLSTRFDLDATFLFGWNLLYWPLILAATVFSFDLVFNTAPTMLRRRESHWATPGACLALLLWLTISFGFQRYLTTVPGYSAFYGSLGAVILLLVWFFVSSFALLAGVYLNVATLEIRDESDSSTEHLESSGDRPA